VQGSHFPLRGYSFNGQDETQDEPDKTLDPVQLYHSLEVAPKHVWHSTAQEFG
jgi:hypothetical protein